MQYIIIGLGNPGLKYKKTRHNVGFMVLDILQKEWGLPKFKLKKQFHAAISEKDGVILVKPQTFMNSSGLAVKLLIGNWKLEIGNCIMVHDDFDLPLGEVRVSQGSGSGGHKGVQSIIDTLKTNNFQRIRLGIRPIGSSLPTANLKAENCVLKKFAKDEQFSLQKAIKKSCQLISELAGRA